MKKTMPTTRVLASHGLGNQLFQFAFAHFIRNQKYSVTFENNPIWSYGLKFNLTPLIPYCSHIKFKVNPTISHETLIGRGLYKTKLALPISKLLLNFWNSEIFYETDQNAFTFNPKILELDSTNKIYIGHWIHWKYLYCELSEVLLDIKNFLNSLSLTESLIDSRLPNVVIHVRHGDYLKRGNQSIFGVVTNESYEFQINLLRKKFGEINLITVTDDYELVNDKSLVSIFGKILPPNLLDEWNALSLMSKADFVISSNSTLSWWGAMLATSNKAIGMIPEKFYRGIDSKGAFDFPGIVKYSNNHYS
jgi:hypothetical protein